MPWLLLGALAGALIWIVVLLLPWRPWSTRERVESGAQPESCDLSDVTVLIPARNEADTLNRTLRALDAQGEGLRVVVVDDQSSDGTSDIAVASGLPDLIVVPGQPVPTGWSGKVWALEQGRQHLMRPITLLLDADIELSPELTATTSRSEPVSRANTYTEPCADRTR